MRCTADAGFWLCSGGLSVCVCLCMIYGCLCSFLFSFFLYSAHKIWVVFSNLLMLWETGPPLVFHRPLISQACLIWDTGRLVKGLAVESNINVSGISALCCSVRARRDEKGKFLLRSLANPCCAQMKGICIMQGESRIFLFSHTFFFLMVQLDIYFCFEWNSSELTVETLGWHFKPLFAN